MILKITTQRRLAANVLMMLEPALPHLANGDRHEAKHTQRAGFEMREDFGGESFGFIAIRTNARLTALSLLEVAEIPDAFPQVDAHATYAKGLRLFDACAWLGSWHFVGSGQAIRYKALQTNTTNRHSRRDRPWSFCGTSRPPKPFQSRQPRWPSQQVRKRGQ